MDIFEKFAKKAYNTGFIGLVTLGIMPAFGAIALGYANAAKKSPKPLNKDAQSQIKNARIMAFFSFALFVADVAIALIVVKIKGL